MKKHSKVIMLILCISLLPLPAVHASISDSTYVLFIGAPAAVYAPTLEFEAGNILKVIGASWEYGELTGIWQEVDFLFFTFFQAQVEQSEPATTTTIPDIPDISSRIQSTEVQPAEETTKFLINLAGITFVSNPLPNNFPELTLGLAFGTGAYLGAEVFFVGFTQPPIEGEDPSFGSISPREGTQEQTISTVTVTGNNTTFRDSPPVEVAFIPPDGIEITSGITVQSNTKIEFSISIAVDAPLEKKTVTVTYDEGNESITGNAVFEILPKP